MSKLNSKHILVLSTNDRSNPLLNEDISIIKITDCKNLDEAIKTVQNLNFQSIPNIFSFVIELVTENLTGIEKLQAEIINKFLHKRSLLLQISSVKSQNVYVKMKNENFRELNFNLSRSSLVQQIKHSTFSVDAFFNILKLKNCSLIDADLSQIYSFLDLTETDQKLSTFAINSCDELCFRLLNLFDVNLVQETNAEIVTSAIRTVNFDIFLSYFNVFKHEDIKKEDIAKILRYKGAERSENAFMTAVKFRNLKVLNFLLNFTKEFDNFFNFNLWKSAWYYAIEREYFDVLDQLKNSDFDFTELERDLKFRLVENYEKIIVNVAKLHEDIHAGNLDAVKEFVKSHQKLKLCYGNLKICALEWSVDCQQFEIHAYLRSKGFYTDKGQQFALKIESLSIINKRKIRDENLKYTTSDPDSFIGVLLSKCSFDACSSLHFDEIRQMLIDLSKIKEFRPYMQIAALSDVKIIFDFKTESVKTMDPTRDEQYMGVAYYTRDLLFVGKNFSRKQLYGTFAHEMTHYILYLVFENDCLPYCKDDKERESKWIEVVAEVKRIYEANKENTDNIIKWVFEYYDEGYEQRAEAAVRVNDMLAFYFDNPVKIQEIRSVFFCLFNFNDEFILPDLNLEAFKLKILNNNFALFTKMQDHPVKLSNSNNVLIRSNVPHLSIYKLHKELKKKTKNLLNFKFENIFLSLKDFCQADEKTESLMKSTLIKSIIIDASDCSEDHFSKISTKLRPNVDYFVVISSNSCKFSLQGFQFVTESFDWHNLDSKSQKKLLKKKFKFQNFTKKLSDIIPVDKITGDIITELIKLEGEIPVNCYKLDEKNDIYIQRKLQRENEAQYIPLDSFIESVKDEKVVLLSDIAGSGKTFILNKIKLELLKKFPNDFIAFANFRDFSSEFENSEHTDFPSFVCEKVLKLNSPLEIAIFHHFYLENRVRLLLDGIDETSRDCKDAAIKLLKNQTKGQVWITTRDYLKEELEKSLNATSFKLMPYSIEDKVQFVVQFWTKNTKNDPTLIKDCAKLLVDRLSLIFLESFTNFFGIPLTLHIFTDFYKEKLSNNFESVLDQTLKIAQAYDQLIWSKTYLWSSLTHLDTAKYHNNSITVRVLYHFFALKQFFAADVDDIFGINFVSSEWNLEEITKAGIIYFDSYGRIRFMHQTLAEKFTSEFILKSLNNTKTTWMYLNKFVDFIVQILTEEKFKIVRFFLNESIFEVKMESDVYKVFMIKFDEAFVNQETLKLFLVNLHSESIYNLALFFTNSIRVLDNDKTLSSLALKSKNELNYIFSNIFRFNSEILLKFLVKNCSSTENPALFSLDFFDNFLTKIEERKFTKSELGKIFGQKNNRGEGFLSYAIENFKFEKLLKVLTFLGNDLHPDDLQKMILSGNEDGRNFLHHSMLQNDENKLSEALGFVQKVLGDEKVKELLEFNKNKENFLFFASKVVINEKGLNILLEFYKKNLKPKDILPLLIDRDVSRNFVLFHAIFSTNAEVLKVWFSFHEESLTKSQFLDILKLFKDGKNILEVAKDTSNFECVQSLTKNLNLFMNEEEKFNFKLMKFIETTTDESVSQFLSKLQEISKKEKFSGLFKSKELTEFLFLCLKSESKKINAAYLLSAVSINSLELIEFMWEIYAKVFTLERVFQETSTDFWIRATKLVSSEEIIKFVWHKIASYHGNETKIKAFLWEHRGSFLHTACFNENSFQFVFEELYCKFFDFKSFIYEADVHNHESLFQRLSGYGSLSMFKLVIRKLEDEVSNDNFKEFLKLKNIRGENLLNIASKLNKRENLLEFLVRLIEKELGMDALRKVMSEVDNWNRIPLHLTAEFNSVKNFRFIFSFYQKYFSKEEIKKFAKYKTEWGNIFKLAYDNTYDKEMFEVVKEKFTSIGVEEGKMSNDSSCKAS